MNEKPQRGRRRGSRNTRPTKQEVAGYYELLRSAAQGGDVTAAHHLIDLHERHKGKQP